jgi:hypothetical protein
MTKIEKNIAGKNLSFLVKNENLLIPRPLGKRFQATGEAFSP